MPALRSWMLPILLSAVVPGLAAEVTPFNSQPWIEDLHQIQSAFSEKYANLEWAVFEREINLTELFATAEARLREATSDEAAKLTIDRLTRTLADGAARFCTRPTLGKSDVLIGLRSTDGMRRKGLRVGAALPKGVAEAVSLCKRERCASSRRR